MQLLFKSQLLCSKNFIGSCLRKNFIHRKVKCDPVRGFATAVYSGNVRPGKYSYLSIPGELPLTYQTLGQLVDSVAERLGSAEALYEKPTNTRLTFADIKDEADKLAAGFLKLGFQPGDRVGIWGPNSREWYMVEMALGKAGLISVYVNPAYKTREVLYCLNKVGMKGMVIAGQFKSQNYYEMMVEAVPEIANSQPGEIKSTKVPTLTTLVSMESSPPGSGAFTYGQVISEGTSKDTQKNLAKLQENINADGICNIQFTSGTTGNPKGVMLTHHNTVNNSLLVGKRLGLTSKDKLCLPVPLFHCYGNVAGVMAALHYGSSIVFPSPGFDPLAAVQVTAEERCTVMYGTPTMHIDMLNVPELQKYDITSLRKAVTAGAICPEELIRRMKVKYTVDSVDSLYGLTETSPVFFQSLPQDSDETRAATVGYPQEHTEVKIVDSHGRVVPVGVQGEMCARGYMVMKGYWEDMEKTREAIDDTRWFHTGDLFVMDPSGHARIVGRIKDMIIRGGENIYPREVEEYLNTHPKIIEPHVFGLPDKRLGETVAVWIRLKEGETMTVDEVKAFCKGQISHYKIPQYIHFTTEFPKTTSGKIQKFKMRQVMMEELGIGTD